MRSLSDFFLFSELPQDVCRSMESELEPPVRYTRGEAVYRTHTFRRAIGLILHGSVTVHACGDSDRRMVINRLSAGELFGVAALYDDSDATYVTEITADSDTVVRFIDQDTMSRLMETYPSVARSYIRFLSGRVRFLNRKLSALTDGDAENRLYRYLLAHRDENGTVRLPISMTELANTLNMGRSSLYRSLDALVSEGILQKQGKTYQLL